jgi:DNA adenine methylase
MNSIYARDYFVDFSRKLVGVYDEEEARAIAGYVCAELLLIKWQQLNIIQKELSNVEVEHFNKISHFRLGDFETVIKEFDSPTTYFYVDPPYWKTENYYSNHDFDREDHERLANLLTQISGKFSLSYYDFDLLSLWYPKETYIWETKQFAKAAAAKKGVSQNMGEELLIMNYKNE